MNKSVSFGKSGFNQLLVLAIAAIILLNLGVVYSQNNPSAQTNQTGNESNVPILDGDMYEINISTVNNVITGLETARFKVFIKSLNDVNDKVNVDFGINNVLFANTNPSSVELSGINFEGKETKSFNVELKPMKILPGSIYSIELNFESENYDFEDRVVFQVYYDVIPLNRSYQTLLKIENVDYPVNLDPRNEFIVKVDVRNFFPKDEDDIIARVKSPVFDFAEEFDIGSNVKKTVTISKKLDSKLKPQFFSFQVVLERNGTNIASIGNLPLRISSYEDIEKSTNSSSFFLKSRETRIYKNNGNDVYESVVKIPVNFFSKMFISANHEEGYFIRDKGGQFLAFDLELEPEEEYVLIITRNYRSIFFILVGIGVIFGLYFVFRSPVVVNKKAHILTTKEGGIRDMKVIISVKNRSHREVRDVEISEIVPKIAEVNLDLPVGTINPTKVVKNEYRGTLVKWEIEKMDRLEERIISFVIKSKLSILGNLRLKPTYVSFTDLNKRRRVKSRELIVRI